jgi:hypothetical protein
MKPRAGSLVDVEAALEKERASQQSNKYSGGSLAGLGIAMLLVGAVLSFGLVKFLEFRKKNMAGLPRFGK